MVHDTRDHTLPNSEVATDDDARTAFVHPHYQIFNAIGTDASGTLYRGKSIVDDRIVAIKVFTEEATPAPMMDYKDEVHLSNLIDVKDVLSGNNGVPFAVMDTPGGASLEKVLSKKDTLPIAAAVHIALNVSLVVRAMHMQNETHGHLNPHNVFLKRQPNGRIGVQLLHCKLKGKPSRFNQATYLSPELISEKDVVQPSDDCWAIAVLLYQMIFGAPPFPGNIRDDIVRRILSEALALPQSFTQKYETLATFFQKSLSRELNERYSGREMNLVLKSIVSALRRRPDSDMPDGMAPEVDSVETEKKEIPRSVPAESFVDEDLKDTRPEEVVDLDAEAAMLSRRTVPNLSSAKQLSISEDMRDTSPGVYTVAESIGTPAPEFTPIVDADLVALDTEESLLSRFAKQSPATPSNAIVVAEVEEVSSASSHMDFVQLAHSLASGPIGAKKPFPYIPVILAAAVLIGISVALTSYLFTYSGQVKRQTQQPRENGSSAKNATNHEPAHAVSDAVRSSESESRNDDADGTEEVVVVLKGLPANARVTVNGIQQNLPLVLPRTSTPVAVQASIGNRIVFAETLIPEENQTFHVIGVHEKQKRRERKKRRADNDSNTGSSSINKAGSLSSNPHQLRGNPFATGAKE